MAPPTISSLPNMRQHIPNLLTLSNLFCGCCAVLYILSEQQEIAALFTLGSFFFDYLDGMVARALKVSSPLGKELDSLADVVSFGVVPGTMLYMLLKLPHWVIVPGDTHAVSIVALPAFVLSMFSALRLAKFNLDTRQGNYFIGLSTPACTVFVLGLALTVQSNVLGLRPLLLSPWLLYGLIAVLSWLLVSEIPMFGMKIKRFDWTGNRFNLAFLLLFAVLVFFLKALALSAIIVVYVLASVLMKGRIVAEQT
ncbi:MAG: CDP-diacylglycerol--serine O-phosphatidyltransferase [Saprospiraceae bacterium]